MEVQPQIRLIVVAELGGNKEILGGRNGIRVRQTSEILLTILTPLRNAIVLLIEGMRTWAAKKKNPIQK